MVRSTEQGFTPVGVPNGDYMSTPKNVPAGFKFCLPSASGVLLMSSDDRIASAASRLPAFDHASGSRQWGSGDSQYNAAFWKLLIGPIFMESPWTVVISQLKSDALCNS